MILILVLITLCLSSMNGKPICPLSSKLHLNSTNTFYYPVDIYAPYDIYLNAKQKNELFNCSAFDRLIGLRQHNCTLKHKFCPVHSQNVRDATSSAVNAKASLCHLQSKLADKHKHVRVFVMGGSSTAGSKAGGCAVDAQHQYVNTRCAWPHHFGEWLKTTSAAKVSLFNLGTGGHNSYLRSRTFPEDLPRLGVKEFTENDVIMVDHSINDNVGRQSEIERGLESLILRIYSVSRNNTWPTIIMLDADAQKCHRPIVKGAPTLLYPVVYENMARHYNLSLWSYRRAVWSNYSLTSQRNYAAFINFDNNHCDIHPTWHVHLFTADLYAAIFQTALSQCSPKQVSAALHLHSHPLHLPPPRNLLQTHTECTTKFNPFVSMSYNDIKSNYSVFGSYSVHPTGSWQLREDRKGL